MSQHERIPAEQNCTLFVKQSSGIFTPAPSAIEETRNPSESKNSSNPPKSAMISQRNHASNSKRQRKRLQYHLKSSGIQTKDFVIRVVAIVVAIVASTTEEISANDSDHYDTLGERRAGSPTSGAALVAKQHYTHDVANACLQMGEPEGTSGVEASTKTSTSKDNVAAGGQEGEVVGLRGGPGPDLPVANTSREGIQQKCQNGTGAESGGGGGGGGGTATGPTVGRIRAGGGLATAANTAAKAAACRAAWCRRHGDDDGGGDQEISIQTMSAMFSILHVLLILFTTYEGVGPRRTANERTNGVGGVTVRIIAQKD
ncbi:hypothetical protein B0J14DRAFT_646995 [Halenospora varia]|nr:hypothetical protein B0J14DRAFT_646995 [Halenospora varia]